MSANYAIAIESLHENIAKLDGDLNPVPAALWNVSNALLVVCDALQSLEKRMTALEQLQKQRS